ncbi:MAG: hypothetical protein CMJ48_09700 [Planctomycetaceae bacterium]|nr:hypothetical protein [Planctomycetaceae bacterium]
MQRFDNHQFSRRGFLERAGAVAGIGALAGIHPTTLSASQPLPNRPRVAAIYTVLRHQSHAYNILRAFLGPYYFNGVMTDPGCDVVSFYADQFPEGDMTPAVSRKFGIPVYPTIDKALCRGGKDLAVDAVLLIGEHGDYPNTERGQKMYPRKKFFDEIVAVMRRSQRFAPIFNDKHLSYRWDWAKEMYDVAKQHGIPFMAGSSVPLGERRPPLELPPEAEIEDAVSIHGGGLEAYDFHGLEVLQSFVEARKGGESGVSKVELLQGEALQRAAQQGRWSRELADAAMQAERDMHAPRQLRRNVVPKPGERIPVPDGPTKPRHGILLTYKDGFRATMLTVGGTGSRWNFACRLKGEDKPRATAFFNGPWGNRNLFRALSHSIQYLFKTHKEPYPVERTLLVTGMLDAVMRSHEQGGTVIATPELEFPYQPIDFRKQREMGASWKKITIHTRQPEDFEPLDADLKPLHLTGE